ncbi:MAG: metallophosphoesterase [Clostridia bacterium]|nr:metallophosphoesterase [Clostridia bacterium]
MKYYMISDPHGFFAPTRAALERAGFFGEAEPHKLVVCGDLLDRGRGACELIAFLKKLLEEERLIYILGNHEDLFVQCLQELSRGKLHEIACGMSYHYTNGTWDTVLQLSGMTVREAMEDRDELLRRVRASDFYRHLLPSAINYYETPHYVFCHGWIPVRIKGYGLGTEYYREENWRGASACDWQKARWLNGMEMACERGLVEPEKTVVCGHWNTSYGHAKIEREGTEWGKDADFTPFRAPGIVAMDACTAESNTVNCIVIED